MTTWRLEFDNRAARQLLKLGSTDRQRIRDYLDGRVLTADDPRQLGHALTGDLKGHWSVWVNSNWRLTFTFEGSDAVLVDYQDYH